MRPTLVLWPHLQTLSMATFGQTTTEALSYMQFNQEMFIKLIPGEGEVDNKALFQEKEESKRGDTTQLSRRRIHYVITPPSI